MKKSNGIPLRPLPFQKKRISVKTFLENMYCRFEDDDVPAMGAQLTYYLILSFFPFLIFILALVSFTDMSAQDSINTITRVLPKMSNKMILDTYEEIQKSRSGSLLSIGILATIWSASSGINAVMKALNKAYDAEENRPYWKVQGLSIIFTIALAIVIIFSLFMLIFGKMIGEMIYKFVYLPGSFETIWRSAQYIIPLSIMVVAFIFLYLLLPNLRLKVKEVLPGALFATGGWIVTSLLFSFYVNNFSNYSKTYGSIGGIIVLLIWLYLSSIVIVLGGEVNATLHFGREGKNKINCKKFSLPIPFFNRKNDHNHTL